MPSERPAWNAWDVPFFGASPRAAAAKRPSAVLPLVGDETRTAERLWAVLLGFGGVVAGTAATGLLLAASFVLSFGSEPSRAELVFAFALGSAIVLWGLTLAVLTYRHASIPLSLTVSSEQVEIRYRTFSEPLVVPRVAVRAVTMDDTPVLMFTNNRRFPIAGPLPEHVFADALDNLPRLPWEDLDPSRRAGGSPSAGVIWEGNRPPVTSRYRHDEPDRDAWAAKGSAPVVQRDAHLWSADGSSLPFLRLGAADAPNIAVLFDGLHPTPRPPWWFHLSPLNRRVPSFIGGRAVRGVLLRLRDPAAAAAAFAGWNVFRPITAGDVLEHGLLVAKPLRGWRIAAYAVMFLGPILIDLILRRL